MFEVLKRFGFGDSFITCIRMLYLCPASSVLSNADRSRPFELHGGVRQGNPLSPLLFDLALEPLAIGIRNHPCIHGISIGNIECLVNLYADDLLLFISDPVVSVPNLLNYINSFSKLSGYTINKSRSEFVCVTKNLSPSFFNSLPFKIADDCFTYLGIKVPRDPRHLFNLSFLNMIDKLKANIERWKLLPLSMIGGLMYQYCYFAAIFISFSEHSYLSPWRIFKTTRCSCFVFYMGLQNSTYFKKTLTKPTTVGGLGLPVFKHYYWAANARALTYWQWGVPSEQLPETSPLWLKMEILSVPESSLCVFLFSKTKPFTKVIGNNVVVRNSLKILNLIKSFLSLPLVSTFTPTAYNHFFVPSQLDKTFPIWGESGLKCIKDLHIDSKFASFDPLRTKFGLSGTFFSVFATRTLHSKYTILPRYAEGACSRIPDI